MIFSPCRRSCYNFRYHVHIQFPGLSLLLNYFIVYDFSHRIPASLSLLGSALGVHQGYVLKEAVVPGVPVSFAAEVGRYMVTEAGKFKKRKDALWDEAVNDTMMNLVYYLPLVHTFYMMKSHAK